MRLLLIIFSLLIFPTYANEICSFSVKYYGFDNKSHEGTLEVNCSIKKNIKEIFEELYQAKYQIEKINPLSKYNYDDEKSMEDNNTSGYNNRNKPNSNQKSKHALGLAIDINPLYNPYIKGNKVLPKNAKNIKRQEPCNHCIKKNDICHKAFIKRGFSWGGSWGSMKDYQHFEKN